jgi:hypothetical protein
MAGGIDWFRWHHGSVTDPKFQLVARKSGASLPDVLAVWAYLLEQASASETRGHFGDVDAEALDCLFGFPSTETRTANILAAFQERGLTEDDSVSAWEKRQPKREDDTAAERKRRQREREHELQMQTNVTCSESRNVTQSHAEVTHGHDRGEERREEKREDTFSGKSVGAAVAARTTGSKAVQLPEGWQLPRPWGEWALAEYPAWTAETVRLEAAKFADHWRAKSGKESRKADWFATWRNWCRSDIAQRAHKPTFAQQAADVARTTVPAKTGRDPVLLQIEADRAKAVPPSLEVLERMAKLRRIA